MSIVDTKIATRPPRSLQILRLLGLGLLLGIVLFPLVFDLHRIPIQPWDEARMALSAHEMYESGNLLITTYVQQPDLWNTKPPLLVWLQAAMIGLLGPTELAIRIPSALAALATVLFLVGFSARALRSLGAGLAAAFILVTIPGYMAPHVARTGDYDALLIWWLVLGLACFFQYLETNRPRYLVLWGIALAAAIMTKGVAALLGSPALVLYVILRGKLLTLLRQPRVWLVLAAALAVPALFYAVREAALPGYWEAVKLNELGGRFSTALGPHAGPWYIYLESLRDYLLDPWTYWIFPALVVLALDPRPAFRWLTLLLTLFIICWLTVISSALTKLEWYPAPVYPVLAWIIGMALESVFQRVRQWLPASTRPWQPLAGVVLLLALVALPYKVTIETIIAQRHDSFSWAEDKGAGSFLRRYLREHPDFRQVYIVYPEGYHPTLLFYISAFRTRGIEIVPVLPKAIQQFEPGTEVIVASPEMRDTLLAAYQAVPVYEQDQYTALQIQGRK
ncbi:ArnT family glycosyltransferase [Hymenobacter lucidus]|uniref:Glycosyltransferase family 39 protein n=1 Tax=Hymenobacter lucidus TaxID=2880930 RepID=A0ABS8ASL4_9BACT|nr:glycosyltransferase family 39 protein [Hymenobacter lucidus]MCB2409193.1 glycosyltransferase family 39 protein [Hymenobacter lucidus]